MLIAPEEQSPFIRDSRFSAQLRTFYFDRDKFDGSSSEAWALGGSISYLSGYLGNFLRIGATGYTSQPLYGPDDRDGTLLLQPGQEGYTVLGQLYGEVKFTDKIFGAIGAKTYNTPYLNTNDTRMTPNTFEGATVYGTRGWNRWRTRVAFWRRLHFEDQAEGMTTSFVSMSEAAGATRGSWRICRRRAT